MSLDHIKQHAKTLHKLLPEFFKQHPDGGKLSDCQELAARMHGFPNFHAAVSSARQPAAAGGALAAP